jgi:hypothetical protein
MFTSTILSNRGPNWNKKFPYQVHTCTYYWNYFNFFRNLNFWSKFVSEYSNRPFSQTTSQNEWNFTRLLTYMYLNYWNFLNFFWKLITFGKNLEVYIQIDRSLKRLIENEWIFPSCLHTCTWIIGIISIF